ncbi:MAG: PAS domain-containing protein [Bacteroidota bacterium]
MEIHLQGKLDLLGGFQMPYVLLDKKACVHWANDSFKSLSGLELKQDTGTPWLTEWEKEQQGPHELIDKLSFGIPFTHTQQFHDAAGKACWLKMDVQLISGLDSKEAFYLAACMDITKSKRQHERLSTLEAILERIDDAILVCDASTLEEEENGPRILEVNRAFLRQSGFTREEVIGHTPRILHGPATDRVALDKIRAALEAKQEVDVEIINYRKDGTPFWVQLMITPVFDRSGWLTHFVSVQRDITQQKESAEDMARMGYILSETQKIAHIGGWELDVQTRLTTWTEEVYRIHEVDQNFPHNEVNGIDFYHPDDQPIIIQALEEAISKQKAFDVRCRFITAKKNQIWVRAMGHPVVENGTVSKVIGLFQDISPQKNIEEKLRKGTQRLTDILDGTSVGTWEWNLQNRDIYINERLTKIMGYSLDDFDKVTIDTFRDMVHPDDGAASAEKLMAHFNRKTEHFEYELRMWHKEQRWIWCHLHGKVSAWSEDGQPLYMSGMLRDVTEQRNMLDTLQTMTNRFNMVQDAAGIGVWDLDLAENKLIWDEQMHQLYQIEPADFSGNFDDWAERVHPDDLAEASAELDAAIAGEKEFDTQFRIIRKDGQIRHVSSIATVLKDSRGKPCRVIGLNNDITEQVQNLSQLNLLNEVVSSVKDSIIITESNPVDQRIIYANPAHHEMTGYSLAEIKGKSPRIFQGPSTNTDELKKIGTAIRKGHPVQVELLNYHKDGSEFWVNLIISYVRNKAGDITHFVSVQRDVTNRKKAEIILREAKETAEKASAAKSEFLSTMSHEIRTPLNAVIGMTGLLAETELDREQRKFLSTIRQGGENLLSVINDILDYSKIEAGKVELEKEDFTLLDPVEDTLDLLAAKAYEKNIELMYQVDKPLPRHVKGDITRLRQVLVNLVGNAIKFTRKGEVMIRLRQVGANDQLIHLEFAVQDTGIGIPPEKMDRLFRSFSQVDASTTRKFGGTGLGLAISRQLVALQGGEIWAESTEGKGSTFFFTVTLEKVDGKNNIHILEQPLLEGKHVIIVDDNQTNLSILEAQLEIAGMKVTTFSSPLKAFEYLRAPHTAQFDLGILDYHMPEIDGLKLAEEIRATHKLKDLPLMLLSSGSGLNTEELKRLFDSVMQKPARQNQLIEEIQKMIFKHLSNGNKSLKKQIEEVELDLSDFHILLVEDNPINQKVAKRILKKFRANVEIANNGLEALEFVQLRQFDLVLMDMQMPEMDGLDATRAIRKLEGMWQPPILAMTANASEEDRQACLASGMDDFLTKPIKLEVLRKNLRKWLLEGHVSSRQKLSQSNQK